MTSERQYKKTKSTRNAVEDLRREAGGQFDPRLVALFVEQVASPLFR
jgi:HD-GYP domain-containing protein (c-di-GMP phosphodiesterase class II)